LNIEVDELYNRYLNWSRDSNEAAVSKKRFEGKLQHFNKKIKKRQLRINGKKPYLYSFPKDFFE
jgi:phage/plasmid-associated DNA primase